MNRVKTFQATFGVFFLFIPLILITTTGEVRQSVSNYYYSAQSNLFVSLLSLSGFLFILDAWVNKKHWNFLTGISLIGVAITPHLDYPVSHHLCAGTFFLWSVFSIIYFSSSKQRIYKTIIGTVIIGLLIMSLTTKVISLFYAEWLGILPISLNLIGEAYNIID